ncbi:MAG: YfhO family protein [Coriobacteriales bacterium]|nr:YfhO family protein [Coriobacteriales bacterium]
MENTSLRTGRLYAVLCYGAAFLIPLAILFVSFAVIGMVPFGERNLEAWDLEISYTNNYEWLANCLAGNDSLFYTFSKSLGGNAFAGWASGIASPLNLLRPLFGSNPVDFVTFMVVVKFGLAGVASLFYLRHRFKLHPAFSLSLSIGYALMLFMTTQSANPMWMDAVVLLPLVLYGIYCLVHKGKVLLFSLSLLAVILINYYNGYMLCLFSVLYYLFESFLAVPAARSRSLEGPQRIRLGLMVNPGRFSAAFSLTVLMSVVVLLPTVLQLAGGKGSVPPGLFTIDVRYQLVDGLRSFFLGVYEKEYLPQVYTGTLALVAFVWFFFNEKIPKREKIAAALLFGIMVASTWLVLGDRIWLGLRDGNSFYCRFSFLVSAVLLFCAARALETTGIQAGGPRQAGGGGRPGDRGAAALKGLYRSALLIALGGIVIYLDRNLPGKRYALAIIVMCVAVALAVRLLAGARRFPWRVALSLLLVGAVSCEAFLSWHQIISVRNEPTYTRYGEYYRAGHESIAEVEAADQDEADAYRLEKTFVFLSGSHNVQNESLVFGYHGIQLYDSLYDKRVQGVLENLGYTYGFSVVDAYTWPQVTADSLLGVRFVISDTQPLGYVATDIACAWEGKQVYENPHALPLGFGASTNALALVDPGYDFSDAQTLRSLLGWDEAQDKLPQGDKDEGPFEYQNRLFASLLGESGSASASGLFATHRPAPAAVGDDEISWSFELPAAAGGGAAGGAPGGGYQYGYVSYDGDLPWLGKARLVVDGTPLSDSYLDIWTEGIFPLGTNPGTSPGSTHRIVIENIGEYDPGKFSLVVASLDYDRFEAAIEKLRSAPFEIDAFEGGYVHGFYTATGDPDEMLFTTIPYAPGWTIKVNGETVDPLIAQDTFIALAVAPGQNEIEMSYFPPGLMLGSLVSAAALLAFVAFVVVVTRRDRSP